MTRALGVSIIYRSSNIANIIATVDVPTMAADTPDASGLLSFISLSAPN